MGRSEPFSVRECVKGSATFGIRLRAFPLGLLAPCCLARRIFRTSLDCGLAGAGVALVWGKEGLLPPVPPRLVRPLRGAPGIAGQGSANRRHQPPSSCSSVCAWCRFRFETSSLRLRSALILCHGRPSGNALRQTSATLCVLAPPSHARTPSPQKRQQGLWAGLPSFGRIGPTFQSCQLE